MWDAFVAICCIWHVGPSPPRDQTHVPLHWEHSLIYWTAREVPKEVFLYVDLMFDFLVMFPT